MLQASRITTNNGVAASLSVKTQLLLPPSTQLSPFEASLMFIPRLNSDGTVTLETQTGPRINLIAPLNFGAKLPHLLLTVGSGETIVICSPLAEPGKSGGPYYSDGSPSLIKPYADQAMLIFITPTIIGESSDHSRADANGGQSVTVTP